MDIESLIISSSYVGIFALMILNGICGFPSSQLIYIVSGWFAFNGQLNVLYIIILGALGHTIGNFILYEVSRRKGLKYITKFKIFPKKEILKVNAVMKKKGWWFLFFGKLVNPVKIIISIPCGISKLNRVYFNLINLITNTLWATVFVLIGYYFGKTWSFAYYYGIIMLVLFILISSIFYKYMNSDEILKEINKSKL